MADTSLVCLWTPGSYLRECLTIRENKLPDDFARLNTTRMLEGALV